MINTSLVKCAKGSQFAFDLFDSGENINFNSICKNIHASNIYVNRFTAASTEEGNNNSSGRRGEKPAGVVVGAHLP